jgi:hypothetical protein
MVKALHSACWQRAPRGPNRAPYEASLGDGLRKIDRPNRENSGSGCGLHVGRAPDPIVAR